MHIPLGSTRIFKPGSRARETGSRRDETVFLTVARLDPVKRLDLIMDALAEVARRNPARTISWHVIGDGECMTDLRDRADRTALPNFYSVEDSHHQAIRAAMLTSRDAVLCFSYSGSTRDMVELLKLARERGAGTVLVTRFPKSPGAALADIVLECGAKEGPLQMGSIAARMGQLYLTDVLFNEMCRRDMESCRERRRAVADALADKHL